MMPSSACTHTTTQTLVMQGRLEPPAGHEADASLDGELIASALASLPQLKSVHMDLPCSAAMLSGTRPDIQRLTHAPHYWA